MRSLRCVSSWRTPRPRRAALAVVLTLTACDRGQGTVTSASSSDLVKDVHILAPAIDIPLPAFELVDHEGKPFTRDGMLGAVWVTGFIFTSCPTVCPGLTRKLSALAQEHEAEADVRFLTLTIDPENDTPEKLAAFASKHGTLRPSWKLVTGKPEVVDQTVLKGFVTPFARGASPAEFTHSERFVVVDKRGHVRGVFDSDEAGLAELRKKVQALRVE